ncbi:glycosyltransferase [Parasphingopyxis algicola]|uniref:glycosyltransferase n=1 Tax=Parasphingopyxis algicola TaxID=2026624 RepID=UPI0015A3F698|nr:glycosyltransferase [Parasphingopyxis algicola]QLC25776.1 glycosyltransferase [Parasphingopyxis algicola]
MQGGGPLLELAELAFRELALFAAFGFLLGALDNLAVDILWLRRMIRRLAGRRDAAPRTMADLLPPDRPGRHAIFIPAWDEAGVIRAMLESTVWRFAGQDYRLFVGCYPNDPATRAEIEAVARRAANIRLVVCRNGIMYQPHQAGSPF